MSFCKTIKKVVISAGAALGAMYITNKVIENSLTVRQLTDSDCRTYEWSNGDVAYTVTGKGKPILLLHNLSATGSSYEWNYIIDALAHNRKVYALDLPGCGRSEKPYQSYITYYFVQLIESFITDIIQEPVDVIVSGNSCPAAISSANFCKDMVSSLCLINPLDGGITESDSTIFTKALSSLLQLPIIGTFVYNMMICRNRIAKLLTEGFFYNPFEVDEELIQAFYESGHMSSSAGRFLLASQLGGYMTSNTEHALAQLDMPINIILGDESKINRDACDAYLEVSDEISVAEVPETGLLPQLEDPITFLQVLNLLLDADNDAFYASEPKEECTEDTSDEAVEETVEEEIIEEASDETETDEVTEEVVVETTEETCAEKAACEEATEEACVEKVADEEIATVVDDVIEPFDDSVESTD
ncbi:MAG: alpha/beta fold hydrolase [Lachnospiraceae bacterium]|nr:alpha/beta fold hydrolase [Candidatus Equihabitans merdae]